MVWEKSGRKNWVNNGENYIEPVWDQKRSPQCSVVHFTRNSWAACGKQDCTFIPPLAVPHDLLKTDVLKARSESKASFFRRSVTEREGEYGSDCKLWPFPYSMKHHACLPAAILPVPSIGHPGDSDMWVQVAGQKSIPRHGRELRVPVMLLMGQEQLYPMWRISFLIPVPFLFNPQCNPQTYR